MAAAQTVTVATVDTGNFEFMAVGADREQALSCLRRTWIRHCREYRGADSGLLNELVEGGEVRFTVLPVGGVGARDGEAL